VDGVGQRLGQGSQPQWHTERQGEDVVHRRGDQLGEAAGVIDADQLAARADVGAAGAAGDAASAGEQRVDRDVFALSEAFHIVAGRQHRELFSGRRPFCRGRATD